MIFVKECPMFFSRSFTILGLIFRSLILFEFIFVYGIRFSNINVLCVAVQFSQNPLFKMMSLLQYIFFFLCKKKYFP